MKYDRFCKNGLEAAFYEMAKRRFTAITNI